MTGYERTGWRDHQISQRHRDWGFNCPATDMDFLLLEFNHGVPVAVVDYKHHAKADPFEGLHENAIKALAGLYDDRGDNLPFFVTRYWPETWAMKAMPMNDPAMSWLRGKEWVPMSEQQWVLGLYKMRKVAIDTRDKGYLSRLNTTQPPPEDAAA